MKLSSRSLSGIYKKSYMNKQMQILKNLIEENLSKPRSDLKKIIDCLRNSYEQMTEKAKGGTIISQENQVNPIKKGEISSETQKRIMNLLQDFENSEDFLRKDITIGLLSSQLNTNSKYLSEIIKHQKSQNFSSYIHHLKINYIVHKLYNEPRYRDYKISHLAEICGYASPQAFFAIFKKINGVTPAHFIQKLNNE